MGQAKLRGSFEERKALAVIRNAETIAERERIRALREAAKTPEQRRAEMRVQTKLAMILAL